MTTWKLSAHEVANTADEAADQVKAAINMQWSAMEQLHELAGEARQAIAWAEKLKRRASDNKAARNLGQALMWGAFLRERESDSWVTLILLRAENNNLKRINEELHRKLENIRASVNGE
mgnify:CR=1 FL=1